MTQRLFQNQIHFKPSGRRRRPSLGLACPGFLSKFTQDEGGQAVVEYILMLMIVVGIIGVIGVGFRRALIGLWEKMARDIAAPCPGCAPPPEVRIR